MALQEYLDNLNLNEMVSILNPSPHDFTTTIVDNTGKPIAYTIKSRQSLTLERYAANHLSNKLVDVILSDTKGVITQGLREKTLKNIRAYDYE